MNPQQEPPTLTRQSGLANRITIALFVIYLLALTWILLFKLGVHFSYMEKREVNFIPFRELVLYNGNLNWSEIGLNVLIFIPLGVYAGILFKHWRAGGKLLFFLLLSLGIETLQFLLRIGAFDVTDIITNTLGAAIGLLLYLAMENIFQQPIKAQRIINGFAVVGTLLMLLFLVLLRTGNLWIKYQ